MFKAVKYGMRKIKGAGLASVCFLGFAFFAMSTVKAADNNSDVFIPGGGTGVNHWVSSGNYADSTYAPSSAGVLTTYQDNSEGILLIVDDSSLTKIDINHDLNGWDSWGEDTDAVIEVSSYNGHEVSNTLEIDATGVIITGGNAHVNDTRGDDAGGAALGVDNHTNLDLTITGGTFQGGNGVTGTGGLGLQGGEGVDIDLINSITVNGGTFIAGESGATTSAETGAEAWEGLWAEDVETVTINAGTFSSGRGGAGAAGQWSGHGGKGLGVEDVTTLNINGGTFTGSQAGTVGASGTENAAGSGAEAFQTTTVNIAGGDFTGAAGTNSYGILKSSDGTTTDSGAGGAGFTFADSSTLNITDTGTTGLQGGDTVDGQAGVGLLMYDFFDDANDDMTLNITGTDTVKITGGDATGTGSAGNGIYVMSNNNATVNLNFSNANATIQGGNASNGSAEANAGLVFDVETGSTCNLTISNGTFQGGISDGYDDTAAYGVDVYGDGNVTFDISGGTFLGGKCIDDGGTGINIYGIGTISGGAFTGNNGAGGDGNGGDGLSIWDASDVTISGGSFTGGNGAGTGEDGHGADLGADFSNTTSTFTITNGTFTGGNSVGNGVGLFMGIEKDEPGDPNVDNANLTLNISGGSFTGGNSGTTDDAGEGINISTEDGVINSTITTTIANATITGGNGVSGESADSGLELEEDGGQNNTLNLTVNSGTITGGTGDGVTDYSDGGIGININDESLTATGTVINVTITDGIISGGDGITGEGGNGLEAEVGHALNVDISGGSFTGGDSKGGNGNSEAADGMSISTDSDSHTGGIVDLDISGGTFTGGKILNALNGSEENGSGVNASVDNDNSSMTIDITGGIFNGGTNSIVDGGVGFACITEANNSTSILNISGGTFNGGDGLDASEGLDIRTHSSSSNSTITATVSGGTFTGGTGLTTNEGESGIEVVAEGTGNTVNLTVSNGTITGGTGSLKGGSGIDVEDENSPNNTVDLIVSGGTITGGSSTTTGGSGIKLGGESSLTMSGGTITGGAGTTTNGVGILGDANANTVTITGGTIARGGAGVDAINLGAGNDSLSISGAIGTVTTITGDIDGGAGTSDTLTLGATGTLTNNIDGFETINKTGSGSLTLDSTISNLTNFTQSAGDTTVNNALVLAGALNVTGGTVLFNEDLTIGAESTIGSTGTVTFADQKTFNLNSQTVNVWGILNINSGLNNIGEFDVKSGGAVNYNAIQHFAGNYDVTGAGTTTINSGAQWIFDDNPANAELTIKDGATFVVNGLVKNVDDFVLEANTTTTLAADGATTLTGQLNQIGGTLNINSDLTVAENSTLAGTTTIGSGGILNLATNDLAVSGNLTVNGSLANVATFTQSGTGAVTLENATTLGVLTQTAGTLTTNDSLTLSGASTVAGTLNGTGTLIVGANLDVTGNLGVANIAQTAGTITLSNDTIISGGLTQTGGIITATGKSITLSGVSDIDGTVTADTLNVGANLDVDGTLNLGILNQSAGTLNLNSVTSLTAGFSQSAGTVNINANLTAATDSVLNGTATIADGVTFAVTNNNLSVGGSLNFAGTGRLGTSTILTQTGGSTTFIEDATIGGLIINSGRVDIGTKTLSTGSLNIANGATLELDKINATTSGTVTVTGTANFATGAKVKINGGAAGLADGDKFTIVNSGATINVDSAAITIADLNSAITMVDAGGFIDFDVQAINGGGTLDDIEVTVTKQAVADALPELDAGTVAVVEEIQTANPDLFNAINDAFDTMSASEVADAIEVATDNALVSYNVGVIGGITSSFNSISLSGGASGRGGDLTSLENTPTGAAGPNADSAKLNTWIKVFGSSGEQDTEKKFTGYESDAYGLALGIEKNIDEKLSIGLSLGTSAIEVNGDKNADSDIDSYHFGLYGKHNTTDFFIESALSYAVSSIDMKTTNAIAALSTTADTDASTYGLYVGGGKTIAIDENLSVTPKLGLTYSHYEQDSYTEKGGLGSKISAYDKDSFVSDLGAKVAMKTGSFTPEFNVAWLHEFENSKDDIDYTIAGGTQVHKSEIRAAESDRFKVGLGTGFKINENFDLNVNYDHEFSSDYSSDSISALLSYKF